MNQQRKYWAIGIIVVIVLIIVWMFFSNNSTKDQSPQTSPITNQPDDATNHDQMDHSTETSEGSAPQNVERYVQEQDAIMADMMKQMEDIPKTENAALDYLHGMIPHHKSAIAMAESYLAYGGENAELKQLAENIIALQKDEIEQMEGMLKEIESGGQTDPEKANAYLEAYNRMMASHHTMHQTTASTVEAAFAEGMIMHHQMAADMSKAILDYTDVESVKTLAENIVQVQEEEIAQMQTILYSLQE